MVGKVIKIDENTTKATRGRFVRMAVLVDLTKPLVAKIKLEGVVKLVEYEALPLICFKCGCYGHMQLNCPSNEKMEANVKEGVPEQVVPKAVSEKVPVVEEQFGAWMVVGRKGRKQNKDGKEDQGGKERGGNNGSRFENIANKESEIDNSGNQNIHINVGTTAQNNNKETSFGGDRNSTRENKGAGVRNNDVGSKDKNQIGLGKVGNDQLASNGPNNASAKSNLGQENRNNKSNKSNNGKATMSTDEKGGHGSDKRKGIAVQPNRTRWQIAGRGRGRSNGHSRATLDPANHTVVIVDQVPDDPKSTATENPESSGALLPAGASSSSVPPDFHMEGEEGESTDVLIQLSDAMQVVVNNIDADMQLKDSDAIDLNQVAGLEQESEGIAVAMME